MTYYVFMNENIRSKATRKKPCMVVYNGKGVVVCSGVKLIGGVVRQSVKPCEAIKTHNVHAWVEFQHAVGTEVKLGHSWKLLHEGMFKAA